MNYFITSKQKLKEKVSFNMRSQNKKNKVVNKQTKFEAFLWEEYQLSRKYRRPVLKNKAGIVQSVIIRRKYEPKNFILRNVVILNFIKKRYQLVKKSDIVILHFLGKKFTYGLKTRLVDVMNCIFGVSIKKFVLFFLSYYGYSINCLLIMSPIEIFQDLHRKLRFLFVNFELRKYIRNNIAIKFKYQIYTGIRAALLLPSRGQRSKTNAGTVKRLRHSSSKRGKNSSSAEKAKNKKSVKKK